MRESDRVDEGEPRVVDDVCGWWFLAAVTLFAI
jgi:hypothetical protein